MVIDLDDGIKTDAPTFRWYNETSNFDWRRPKRMFKVSDGVKYQRRPESVRSYAGTDSFAKFRIVVILLRWFHKYFSGKALSFQVSWFHIYFSNLPSIFHRQWEQHSHWIEVQGINIPSNFVLFYVPMLSRHNSSFRKLVSFSTINDMWSNDVFLDAHFFSFYPLKALFFTHPFFLVGILSFLVLEGAVHIIAVQLLLFLLDGEVMSGIAMMSCTIISLGRKTFSESVYFFTDHSMFGSTFLFAHNRWNYRCCRLVGYWIFWLFTGWSF